MTRKEEQKEIEKHIFGEFTEVCPLDIVSFESKDPPEPDILCELKNGEMLAFEMGSATDERSPHNDDKIKKAIKFLDEHMKQLDESERVFFESVFDYTLTLSLNDQATDNNIKKAIPKIFQKYKNYSRDLRGQIYHEQKNLPKGIKIIRIEQKKSKSPVRISNALFISSNAVIDRLKDKFGKHYDTNNPIHLLIHSEFDPLFFNYTEINTFIEQNINTSPFEKIWLFDWHLNNIVYIFPSTKNDS